MFWDYNKTDIACSFLFDLEYTNIELKESTHNVIYGNFLDIFYFFKDFINKTNLYHQTDLFLV